VVTAAYLPSYFDGSEKTPEGRYWDAFARLSIWNRLLAELPAAIEYEVPLDTNKQYFFCSHPHGATSLHHSLYLTNGCGFHDNASSGRRRRDVAAGIVFSIPIYREFCLWVGAVDADRKVVSKVLSKGWSVVSLLGGIQEQILAQNGRQEICVKDRLGFVKLALEHGVPIVPMYNFGETELYYTSRVFSNLRWWLVKKFRLPIPLFYGPHWYLPLVPRKIAITSCVGRPIEVPRVENPSDAQITEIHAKYIEEIQRLYNANKDRLGYGDQPLHVR